MGMGGTYLWYNMWDVKEQLDSHHCVSVIQKLNYLTEQQQMWSIIIMSLYPSFQLKPPSNLFSLATWMLG